MLIACWFTFSANAQEGLKYRWDFKQVTDTAGTSLIAIDPTDYFDLSSGDTFTYSLRAKNNLLAKGVYQRNGDTLAFTYQLPNDTIREYFIAEETDSTLIITEGPVSFSFNRANTSIASAVLNYDFTKTTISATSVLRGLLGLFVLVAISFLFSSHKRKINWKQVGIGLAIQLVFAYAILKVSWVAAIFDFLSGLFVKLLSFTRAGAEFLFGSLISDTTSLGYIFAFQVLPTVIFFSAITSLLFYWGILQKIVYAFAWVMNGP